jgi:hypothetical protein
MIDWNYPPWDLPYQISLPYQYQISFLLHPPDWKFIKETIKDMYNNDLPYDLTDYTNSIKVLTRIFALSTIDDRNSDYVLTEKPTFNKYNIDGMKTGSFSFSTSKGGYKNYENILTIHDDILYTFEFTSEITLDISEEEYSAIKKHIINSIKWLN